MSMSSKGAAIAFAFLLSALPVAAQAASLYLDPATATYGVGDTFVSTVRLDNENDCINAATVILTYPTDSLRAVDFSRGSSILSLWVGEPQIDTARGTVTFSGGIPGGYCGRIPGDAALSNVLGQVVFTVVHADTKSATINLAPSSELYLNDGSGTPAPLSVHSATITLQEKPTLTSNPWLAAVGQDSTPPESFTIELESTQGVFGGAYYAVFSTTDKQSGLDHYEAYEKEGWKTVTSPYQLPDQSLLGLHALQIRAVDKAGNTTLGIYSATTTPPRQYGPEYTTPLIAAGIILVLLVVGKLYSDRRKPPVPPVQLT